VVLGLEHGGPNVSKYFEVKLGRHGAEVLAPKYCEEEPRRGRWDHSSVRNVLNRLAV
jgi:hypothetical protein